MSFRFDLTDLRLFLNVVELGSITAGAEATQLGLAAASARVLAMEDTLGAPLLERQPRGVQATAAGHTLVLHARSVLQQVQRLHGGLAEHTHGIRVQLRLLCDTVALHELVPERLAGYLLAHPQVNLRVEERNGNEVVSALADGTADVGIVRKNTDIFELESFLLDSDPLVLVVPPGHALLALSKRAPSGAVTLAEADLCDVIGLPSGTALQDLWDQRAAQRGERLNYRVRVGSFDEQCRLVARGAGIALMPQSAAQRHARALTFHTVPLAEDFAAHALRLCVRRLAELPASAQHLVASLRDHAPPLAVHAA